MNLSLTVTAQLSDNRGSNRDNRTNELHTAFSEHYDYDNLDRLTNTTRADSFDQTWTLDGLGNFSEFDDDGTPQTRTANEANEITGISSGVTPTYDAAGNMISGPKTGAPATRLHYVYDAWNRMTAAYLGDADADFEPGTDDKLIANYRYDGANRRIAKELFDTTSGDPTGSTHFYHNAAWQVLEERLYDANSNLTTAYQNVWSLRYIDAMILRDTLAVGQNNQPGAIQLLDRLLYFSDANFNVTGLMKQVAGVWQVVERYLYDAYGKTTFLDAAWAPTVVTGYADGTASAFLNPTLYTGRYVDIETLLFYYRARYFHVDLSRFISRDPAIYRAGDTNLYRYVGDAPSSHCDPYGLERLTEKTGQETRAIIDSILQRAKEDPTQSPGELLSYAAAVGLGKDPLEQNNPLVYVSRNLDDLITRTNKAPCGCVGLLELVGHARGPYAGPFGMQFGEDSVRVEGQGRGPRGASKTLGGWETRVLKHDARSGDANFLSNNNATYVGEQLKKRVRFCKPCVIVLHSCNIGNWRDRETDVVVLLAAASGCTVVAPRGFAGGLTFAVNGEIGVSRSTYGEPDRLGRTYHDIVPEKSRVAETYNSVFDTFWVEPP